MSMIRCRGCGKFDTVVQVSLVPRIFGMRAVDGEVVIDDGTDGRVLDEAYWEGETVIGHGCTNVDCEFWQGDPGISVRDGAFTVLPAYDLADVAEVEVLQKIHEGRNPDSGDDDDPGCDVCGLDSGDHTHSEGHSEREVEDIPPLGRIKVYDLEGTLDRYTIVFMDQVEDEGGEYGPLYTVLGMSDHPDHPQGYSQHGSGHDGPHLGRPIRFQDLPENIRKHAIRRYS